MRICALIPAYNEAPKIAEVAARALRQLPDVYVIDDGSTDGTAGEAERAGAVTVRRGSNGGKGLALREGLGRVFADGFGAAVCLDADGQHLPEEIPAFLAAAERADLAVGDRMANTAGMPWIRRRVNRFTSRLLGALCGEVRGERIRDTQCGFRLVGRRCFEDTEIIGRNFEYEGEMIVAAARAGLRLANVPVTTVYGDEVSHIRPVRDTIRFFRMAWRLWRAPRPAGKGAAPPPAAE